MPDEGACSTQQQQQQQFTKSLIRNNGLQASTVLAEVFYVCLSLASRRYRDGWSAQTTESTAASAPSCAREPLAI